MKVLLELGLNNGVVSVMGSDCGERVKRAERERLMFLAFFFSLGTLKQVFVSRSLVILLTMS